MLKQVGTRLTEAPQGFNLNRKIGRQLDRVPRLAGLVRSEPPSGLGKAFEQE